MPTEPTAPPPVATDGELVSPSGAVLAALEGALEMLSERHGGHVPEWEFCEGVMTALLCTRRTVGSDEWLPMLFGMDAGAVFATPGEQTHFLMHWMERAEQVRTALEAPVEALDDERALEPGVVDRQGFLLSLPESERNTVFADEMPPAFAQAWAAGFLAAVEYWAEEWTLPRDKEIAADMRAAVRTVGALLKADQGRPSVNLYDEEGPPTVSEARVEAFGEAIWAVYDLYAIALSLGPRTLPIASEKIGRNDPCPCGSGKKYKKCCGA